MHISEEGSRRMTISPMESDECMSALCNRVIRCVGQKVCQVRGRYKGLCQVRGTKGC